MSEQILSLVNEIGALLSERGQRDNDHILYDISQVHEALKQESLNECIDVEVGDVSNEEFSSFYDQVSEYFAEETSDSLKNLYAKDRLSKVHKHKKYICRALVKLVKSRGDKPLECWLEGSV